MRRRKWYNEISLGGKKILEGYERVKSAYGVVDVRTDHETITAAISTMVDGNDVAGLFIHFHSFIVSLWGGRGRCRGRAKVMGSGMNWELRFVYFGYG